MYSVPVKTFVSLFELTPSEVYINNLPNRLRNDIHVTHFTNPPFTPNNHFRSRDCQFIFACSHYALIFAVQTHRLYKSAFTWQRGRIALEVLFESATKLN